MDTITFAEFLFTRIATDAERAERWHDLECDVVLAESPVALVAAVQRCDCGGAERIWNEAESKRRILRLHCGAFWSADNCAVCNDRLPCDTLRALALPYAGHDDFREEWRV
jgi:hypothetical protein